MSLDPQLADIIERIERAGRPPFWQLSASQAREAYRRGAPILDIAPESLERVDDFGIRARDGATIPLRHYVPTRSTEPMPLMVFFHGGGFTIGSIETHDAICRMFARRAACHVISVDYRLAPEFPFPYAVNDAFDAFTWVFGNAQRLGIDRTRIAVAGDSAGGTLATVCAVMARDAGHHACLQLLIYPGLAAYQDSASHRAHQEGLLLDAKTIQWFFGNYLSDQSQRLDWRFSPLQGEPRPSFAGLPQTVIVVAEYDPLHDEGVAYATRLREQGVAVQLLDYPGMVHGFFNFGGAVSVARQAHDDCVALLRRAFER
jgi:acetyl esterase